MLSVMYSAGDTEVMSPNQVSLPFCGADRKCSDQKHHVLSVCCGQNQQRPGAGLQGRDRFVLFHKVVRGGLSEEVTFKLVINCPDK